MVIIDHHTVLEAEPCIVTGKRWFWGDMREDGKDKLIWDFEDYERVGRHTDSTDRNGARARTEAGFGCRRSTDGWTPSPAVAVCESGKDCWDLFAMTTHGSTLLDVGFTVWGSIARWEGGGALWWWPRNGCRAVINFASRSRF